MEKCKQIEEATFYVRESDLFVPVKLLEDTPAVLSLGKLCEEYGYSYEWVSGSRTTTSGLKWKKDSLSDTTVDTLTNEKLEDKCEGGDETTRRRHNNHTKGWRSDGSSSCLDGSSHGGSRQAHPTIQPCPACWGDEGWPNPLQYVPQFQKTRTCSAA